MTKKLFALITALLFSFSALSMPKIAVKHQRNAKGFAQVQVSNSTMENLICHVANDGNKVLFRLKAIEYSRWFTATDIRNNHTKY